MVKGIKKNDYDYNDSFIDDDDDDLVFNTRKRKNSDLEDDKFRKFSKMFYKKKINEIDKTSRDRDLIIDDIIDLELSNEDNVWFYDHINVRDYIEDDEQRLKIKHQIYERYSMLKMLKKEGIENDISFNNENIINKILKSKQSKENKLLLIKLVNDKSKNTDSEDYSKFLDVINVILSIPTEIKNIIESNKIINNLIDELNKNMYGMQNVKLKILESFISILESKNKEGKIITFVGPPGVGKTAICKHIANAMNIPFYHISLGSIKDPNDLCGHSSTYIGAKPGILLNIMKSSDRLNNLILLDEVDKIYDSLNFSSINSILIHLLDKTQNDKMRDAYCNEVSFDMSKNFFILSCNDISKLDKILLDRLELVHINGYNLNEKTSITIKSIIPNILDKYNLDKNDFVIKEKNIKNILKNKFSDEISGVREIERLFENIFNKIILSKKLEKKNILYEDFGYKELKFPLKLDISLIENFKI